MRILWTILVLETIILSQILSKRQWKYLVHKTHMEAKQRFYFNACRTLNMAIPNASETALTCFFKSVGKNALRVMDLMEDYKYNYSKWYVETYCKNDTPCIKEGLEGTPPKYMPQNTWDEIPKEQGYKVNVFFFSSSMGTDMDLMTVRCYVLLQNALYGMEALTFDKDRFDLGWVDEFQQTVYFMTYVLCHLQGIIFYRGLSPALHPQSQQNIFDNFDSDYNLTWHGQEDIHYKAIHFSIYKQSLNLMEFIFQMYDFYAKALGMQGSVQDENFSPPMEMPIPMPTRGLIRP